MRPIDYGDLISRKEAIEKIESLWNSIRRLHPLVDDTMALYADIKRIIKQLPSAQPTYTDDEIQKMQDLEQAQIEKAYQLGREDAQPPWIPCSERLPNHDECIKNNGLFNVSDGGRSYSEWYDNDKRRFGEPTMSGFRVDYAVIAWMPLPERYKEK